MGRLHGCIAVKGVKVQVVCTSSAFEQQNATWRSVWLEYQVIIGSMQAAVRYSSLTRLDEVSLPFFYSHSDNVQFQVTFFS